MSLTFESPTHRGQSNDAYFTPLNMPSIRPTTATSEEGSTPYYTAPINPAIHQDFLNAIQLRHAGQPTVLSSPVRETKLGGSLAGGGVGVVGGAGGNGGGGFTLNMDSLANRRRAKQLQQQQQQQQPQPQNVAAAQSTLVLDVRSFVQFSHSHICHSINISIPNTILKRPTFTLDKVYEGIVLDSARERLKNWQTAASIVFYDQASLILQENSAGAYLGAKLIQAGFKGQLYHLKGGFEAFQQQYKDDCEASSNNTNNISMTPHGPPTALPSRRPKLHLNNLPVSTPNLGPFTAPMPQFENQAFNPFFSNIRQNMELSHGPIRERFPVRLPTQCNVDPNYHIQTSSLLAPRCVAGGQMDADQRFQAPEWLQNTIEEKGPQYLAETYEKLERTEQKRLQNIMHFHSKHTNNPSEFPFSIVAGIEMGALNRYTNIWPFDHRRYISTQGPLPATFNDFWQVVWEQNSRVLVMLTKEEEMNKIKCHRYWPSDLNTPTSYGKMTVTLTSERIQRVEQNADQDDAVIVRELVMESNGEKRTITHLQYTGWMDFGVPENPLGTLLLINMANQAQQARDGPMIVHCSAGCGRSGAFCAIDTAIARLNRPQQHDLLFQTISRFREQRLSMVQTLRQFVFCYEAIWWWYLGYEKDDAMDTSL
ncbi:hypothetical protein K501DRAFT_321970 [Backusella circina FSU 941]|nr:hypothetical protein K501DRAFT_321970 [Backusella circina FSU 941]